MGRRKTLHTEKENIFHNHYFVNKIKHLHDGNPKKFDEVLDILPFHHSINVVKDLDYLLMSNRTSEFLNVDNQAVIEKGFKGITKHLIEPVNLQYQMRILEAYKALGYTDKSLNYFQYVKPWDGEKHRWFLTHKFFLSEERFFNFYYELPELGAVGTVLQDMLGEIPLSIEEYESFLSLTKKEMEVVELVHKGFSTLEIAERLFVSEYTIRTHRKNIWHKLGIKNARELSRFILHS
jgi:DNA-binding CsgD family transcriptional regulator